MLWKSHFGAKLFRCVIHSHLLKFLKILFHHLVVQSRAWSFGMDYGLSVIRNILRECRTHAEWVSNEWVSEWVSNRSCIYLRKKFIPIWSSSRCERFTIFFLIFLRITWWCHSSAFILSATYWTQQDWFTRHGWSKYFKSYSGVSFEYSATGMMLIGHCVSCSCSIAYESLYETFTHFSEILQLHSLRHVYSSGVNSLEKWIIRRSTHKFSCRYKYLTVADKKRLHNLQDTSDECFDCFGCSKKK